MRELYWISQHSQVLRTFRFSLPQRIRQTMVVGTIREAEDPAEDLPVAVPGAIATVEAVPAVDPVEDLPVAVPGAVATMEAVPKAVIIV